jgi:MFS family permease
MSGAGSAASTVVASGNTLWQNRNFLKLWIGESTSQAGSRMTDLALPLTGILVLDATPGELGILSAAEFTPLLIVTLAAGMWADRHARRPVLIAANFGRAVLLSLVPILAFTGLLTMLILCVLAFAVGTFTAIFDVTYVAYLPSLVRHEHLVEANSKLEASYSVAEVGGRGASGLLVQALSAPGAIVVDAATYLVAAASLIAMNHPETPRRPDARLRFKDEIVVGFHASLGNRTLRPLILQSASFNALNAVLVVVLPIYALQSLNLGPAGLGLVVAIGGVGAVAGALCATRTGAVLGHTRAMTLGMATACVASLGLPLAGGSRLLTITVIAATQCIFGAGLALFNVHSLSIRQAVVPPERIGRATAAYRLVTWIAIPIGSVLGGLLADRIGTHAALFVAAVGLSLSAVAFAWSQRTAGMALKFRWLGLKISRS